MQAINSILSKNFNRLAEYDTSSVAPDSLYGMSKEENRRLWYRDVENPDTSKFTKYWNAYVPTNYSADNYDFVNFYRGNSDVELAFQFGPNDDLWAYHIFIIKKIDCCYLVTRSYFRHARFTYKAYSVITPTQVDSLFSVLDSIDKSEIDEQDSSFAYRGYVVDNRHRENYFIDFEKQVIVNKDNRRRSSEPNEKVKRLYDFVDNRIRWKATYN